MRLQKKGAIMILMVLTFCGVTEATGFCKFARMFPNHDKKDQNIQFPRLATDNFKNSSLALTPDSTSLSTPTAPWSNKGNNKTSILTQPILSRILPNTDADQTIQLPRLTTDSFKNSSLALAPGSISVSTQTVPGSTKEDATTVETQPILSRILPNTDADCPEWTERTGSLYCFISALKSWEEAVQTCQRYSSRTHLVFIESADENDFLTDFFIQKRQGNINDAWIGLNDKEIEGDWKWGKEKEMLYSNWSDDYKEPNGDERRDEDCVFISMYFDGEWVDELCVTTQAYLICEHEIM